MGRQRQAPDRVIAVSPTGEAFIRPGIGGQDTRKLDPVNDRLEIVQKHTVAVRNFNSDESNAVMLGSTETAYLYWYTKGRKRGEPEPFFTIDCSTVTQAIKNLTPEEARTLRNELLAIGCLPYACPTSFVEAKDAAIAKLREIGALS